MAWPFFYFLWWAFPLGYKCLTISAVFTVTIFLMQFRVCKCYHMVGNIWMEILKQSEMLNAAMITQSNVFSQQHYLSVMVVWEGEKIFLWSLFCPLVTVLKAESCYESLIKSWSVAFIVTEPVSRHTEFKFQYKHAHETIKQEQTLTG